MNMLYRTVRYKNVHLQKGFTLIEVIIAFMIVSISLVMVMRLFSSGLKASRATCDYTVAVVYAKDKMEELSSDPVEDSGAFEDGFVWRSEVGMYKEPEESQFKLLKIKVIVSWPDTGEKQKSVELVSLKAVSEEEDL